MKRCGEVGRLAHAALQLALLQAEQRGRLGEGVGEGGG